MRAKFTIAARALAGVAFAGALLGVAGPAAADGGGYGGGTTPGDDTTYGGTAYGQVGNCSVVSSPSYMGLACAGGDWNKHTIKETLDGDKLPHCWHDQMSPAEVAAMGLRGDAGTTWYWYRCMEGIDPETLKIGPDGVSFTVGVVSIKDPGQVVHLTHNQQQLVNMYDTNGTIPETIAGVSPMAHPRVGAWVSFFDGFFLAEQSPVVTVNAGNVVLQATVERLTVEPLGVEHADEASVSCEGAGYRAVRGDTPATHDGCWWRYERSSANQPDQRYQANLVAHWVVRISSDNGATFTDFNAFPKPMTNTIPVTEIEALVVN